VTCNVKTTNIIIKIILNNFVTHRFLKVEAARNPFRRSLKNGPAMTIVNQFESSNFTLT
jgi:hypothetical protein